MKNIMRIKWLAVFALLILAGCKFKSDETAPTVLTLTPADSSTDIATDASIQLQFSEAIRQDKLQAGSVSLTNQGIQLSGTLAYDSTSATLSFQPAQNFNLGTLYQVDYGVGIEDFAGNPITPGTWHFTSRDGMWSAPTSFSTGIQASSIQVESDNQGFGVAVWRAFDGAEYSIFAAHYLFGFGWGAAGGIDPYALGDAAAPAMYLNRNTGAAIVAWSEIDNLNSDADIWAVIYDPTSGWSAPIQVDQGQTGAGTDPAVFIDDSGRAAVTWLQDVSGQIQIQYALMDTSLLWSIPASPQTSMNNAVNPGIAGNANGQFLLTWTELTSTPTFVVMQAGYDPVTGWSTASLLDDSNPFSLAQTVKMRGDGSALAVWSGGNGSLFEVYGRWRMSDGTLTNIVQLGSVGAGLPTGIALDVPEDGSATVLWSQGDSTTDYQLYSQHYANNLWEGQQNFAVSPGNQLLWPHLSGNSSGVLMASWSEVQGDLGTATDGYVMQSRYRPGLGWDNAQRVDASTTMVCINPDITLLENGAALTTWTQSVGIGEGVVTHSEFE